ncbi:hypothetical protein K470DRAFT_177712 [Piedraia hortae CBS 480.64]|uniref:Uncharacterized protein n=1 Tax=Piedraia hortae CBS 480.64 TaxID=1314780 RepID=A0A6A7BRE3_9PEZI|nr:hypothetical protein K470DRAFT_177712 [Piedraia hortae CBS 480.64]
MALLIQQVLRHRPDCHHNRFHRSRPAQDAPLAGHDQHRSQMIPRVSVSANNPKINAGPALIFATTILSMLTEVCPGTLAIIVGDITYGACCVDNDTARDLGCNLLMHYAHSCLIPVITATMALYVFVGIHIDTEHFVATLAHNVEPGHTIAMVGTIQFNSTLKGIASRLRAAEYSIIISKAVQRRDPQL